MALLQPDDSQHLFTRVSNMIMPSVDAASSRATADGIPIREAAVWVDFAADELQLRITHRLLSRRDIDTRDWKYDIGQRLQAAMRLFHRLPAAKAICVDRRRLVARGEKARKEANRPVRKAVKTRIA